MTLNTAKLNAAIFDMDGTLVDSLGFWGIIWKDIGRDYLGDNNFVPDEDIDKKVRTMIFSDAMLFAKKAYSIAGSDEDFISYTTSKLGDFYRQTVTVKDGCREFLEYLKESGVKMCLASATDMKYVNIALDVLDLRKYFDAVMSCSEIGIGKDKPDIYLRALKALGEEAEDTYIFEDSFVALETAKAIGLYTVGVYDKYSFDQERLKRSSMIYLGPDTDMRELIGKL